MPRQKVTFPGGYLIVRPGTLADEVTAKQIENRVIQAFAVSAPEKLGSFTQFGQLCSQTAESEGLPFKPELMGAANPLVLQQAYVGFENLPKALRSKWITAYSRADVDEAVKIEALPDEERVADPNSSASG